MREAVIRRYRERYEGFGPTLASEKLEKEGYRINHETLRLWLLEEGLWTKQRKRKAYRSWRERKKHRGEMVQMDGSQHDWFEGRRERAVLINMVDDATGESFARFHEGETTRATMETLQEYIEQYGIPRSLYVDRDTIFVTDREPTDEEQLRGEQPLTQFGRAAAKLGINIIPAGSPQAKGRVERKHGVYQDRLVKELRLEGITMIDEGNRLLCGGFLNDLNKRFTITPQSDIDFHRPLPEGLDLRSILCFEKERVIDNDWTVRWGGRIFQIRKDNRPLPPARRKVIVQEWLDGSVHIVYRGKEVTYRQISKKPGKQDTPVAISDEITYYKPAMNHPWRNYKNRPRLVASPGRDRSL